ncbi:lysozyme [bacterium]|nr:lysozyme [bacterium]
MVAEVVLQGGVEVVRGIGQALGEILKSAGQAAGEIAGQVAINTAEVVSDFANINTDDITQNNNTGLGGVNSDIKSLGLGGQPINRNLKYSDLYGFDVQGRNGVARGNVSTTQRFPKGNVDYINRQYSNSNGLKAPEQTEQIEMTTRRFEPKKNYEEIANVMYPSMSEESQIRTSKYPSFEDIRPRVNLQNQQPTIADREFLSQNAENNLLKQENKLLKDALEREIQFNNRAAILFSSMQDKGTMTGGAGNILKGKIEMSVPEETTPHKKFESVDNTKFTDATWEKTRIFITGAEGFIPVAKRPLKDDVLTIGYGHTEGVKEGDTITREEAEKLFKQDFSKYSKPLKYVTVPLNDNEKVALTSFIYNIGPTAFKNSTLLKKLNNGDKQGAANEFDKWIYKNGRKVDGLIKRRQEEKKMFLSPI